MGHERIAIVGIGLTYPDASTPSDLWDNVLAGRRAFRRLPDERMNRADYYSPDPHAPDRFYAQRAAVLRDFEFDRIKYKVAGSTYRSTDLTHWLALDTASRALADAGFPDGEGLPKRSTSVVLGNSLTGEFSRANVIRLRWPYVRRTVAAALTEKGWSDEDTATFLAELEVRYKSPFPPINEDTLAGGLANTIAGRICNFYDLRGGGYTVDGACSSSLLSVVTAANALIDGDTDVALAGGVDLSIDPFEVIGFAKTGALATGEMKVYDKDSNGFWPGEGSGVIVLMRESDAVASGARIYATVSGWGVSSDGKGGITRPEADGHRLALARAYRRAGYGIETVGYFEGHGTGTAVGDATEIEALWTARRDADPSAEPAALSTIKGNIGHTKAAAGIAGLIKATLAIHHQVIPPATGHFETHPLLAVTPAALYVPSSPQLWPDGEPIRAGVSAMGFGGINTHVALEQAADVRRRGEIDESTVIRVSGRQDAELLLLDAEDLPRLRALVAQLAEVTEKLSLAELSDLAAALAERLAGLPVRAAVVAASPEDAARRLTQLLERIDAGDTTILPGGSNKDGGYLATSETAPRITYLFPGQGSGRGVIGAFQRRFPAAEDVFRAAKLPTGADHVATEVAQPRIVAGSLAGLRVLRQLGIEAAVAVGHSLGELTALHWAGAMDEATVLRLASVRGEIMARASQGGGAMAGLGAPADVVTELIQDQDVVVSGYNGPKQTVIAGPAEAVDAVCAKAKDAGLRTVRLAVSHAFHSPMVEPAAVAMAERLAEFDFGRLSRPVVSTVTGDVLHAAENFRALLQDQIVLPVRFREAAAKAVDRADLVIEVGPGRALSGLMADIAASKPTLPLDTDSSTIATALRVAGAVHVLGGHLDTGPLFAGRVIRPIPLDGAMSFLASPCEQAPALDPGVGNGEVVATAGDAAPPTSAVATIPGDAGATSTFELLRKFAAERAELPPSSIDANTHPLDDMHLSSIAVGQLVNEVVRALGRSALEATPNFATARLGELADMIDELAETARDEDAAAVREVAGVAPWVRAFAVEYVPARPPKARAGSGDGGWHVFAPPAHPLAERLRAALSGAGIGDGVLLCLPAKCTEEDAGLILEAGKAALDGSRFVVVQQELGASGLAKTLHLEDPSVRVTIVTLPDVSAADSVSRVVAEVAATTDFVEVRYDADGTRLVPRLRLAKPGQTKSMPLGANDVLLITGGGKGITAECALAIGRDTGAVLALLGRSDPAEDQELAANLERMAAAGVRVAYRRVDVTSPQQVADAVHAIEADHGPVTAVLHGAGRNEPSSLSSLTEEAFRATLAPKITGLRAVLDAVDGDRIKLLVTFGSIIGRAGLRGEAHYATANDWMTELTVHFGAKHPNARVLAMEWSVWSGAGMGEKLGVVEALKRDGITPISTEDGIEMLRELISDPAAAPVHVIKGRSGGLPTLPIERDELPLTRFVDRAVVHYPGIELITEADLSAGGDPYLSDHALDGDLLFPAVLGMEAMTQVATAVADTAAPPLLENIEFLRPVIVAPGGSTTIRLAALAHDQSTVDVVLRSSGTGFSADHFRARLRFPRPEPPGTSGETFDAVPLVPVDPVNELYGSVLFQGKRFQRLVAYRRAAARHAVAEISTRSDSNWFAPFLPQQLLLADPGTRDAMMHAIQCCVPDATLLPMRVDRLYLADPNGPDSDYVIMDARERSQDGDTYIYDVDVRHPSGTIVERWEGLTLRAVRKKGGAGPWVPAMLGPYLERQLEKVLGGTGINTVVEPDPFDGPADRRTQTGLAVNRALGRAVQVRYRPDGKPEVDGTGMSASHNSGLTLVVAGHGNPTCDIEAVVERSAEDWAGLLGAELLGVRDRIVAETSEPETVAATRVWSAVECVRKTGAMTQSVALEQVHEDGWVSLSVGEATVATWVTTVNGRANPVVFAVLASKERST